MKKLLYFRAYWCESCKQLDPIIEEISQKGISVQIINIDTNQDASDGFNINSIPTVVLTVGGVDFGRKVGFNHINTYIDLYNQG